MRDPYLRLALSLLAVGLLAGVYFWLRRTLKKRAALPFAEEAKRAIVFARVEAGQLGATVIEPIHLLLGVLHVQPDVLNRFVPSEQLAGIRQQVVEHVTPGPEIPASIDLPYSDSSRHSLQAAAREARGLSASQIGAEHLLLGLLHEEDSLAALVLRERGVRLEGLRARVGGWRE